MDVSLVLATVGRFECVLAFCDSLEKQVFKNYELIIVDQNPDDKLKNAIEKKGYTFSRKYLKISQKGLSHARNVGLKYATNKIIAFPDDDCEYTSETLLRVVKFFEKNDKYDGLSVKKIHKKESIAESKDGPIIVINKYNAWVYAISYTIFLRKKAVEEIGEFDEALGVGAGTKYGSGEETDYLLRGLSIGQKMGYKKDIIVYHPPEKIDNIKIKDKAMSYSYGRMHVLYKHKYNMLFILANRYYPLFKMLINILNPYKRKYAWYQFIGRWRYKEC